MEALWPKGYYIERSTLDQEVRVRVQAWAWGIVTVVFLGKTLYTVLLGFKHEFSNTSDNRKQSWKWQHLKFALHAPNIL